MIEGLDRFKEVLEEEGDYLLDRLTLNPLFFASLVAKKICTDSELDDIECLPKRSDQVWEVIKLLKKRGRREFESFLGAMKNTGQGFIVTKLLADLKCKARAELDDSKVGDNIANFLHSRLILKKLLPMIELKYLEENLVVKADYNQQAGIIKQLHFDVQEAEEKLKEEKDQLETTQMDMKQTMTMFNNQLKDNQKLQIQIEEVKHEMQKAKHQVLQLKESKFRLQKELDQVCQRLEAATSIDVPDSAPEVKEDGAESQIEIIQAMEEQMQEMEEKAKSQECDIVAMNKKIQSVMGIEGLSEDQDDNKMEELVKNLDHLLKEYAVQKEYIVEEKEDGGEDEKVYTQKSIKKKRETSEHRQKLLKQLKTMKKKMTQMNTDWEGERYEMQLRVQSMQKSLKAKIWEVRKLEDQMACLSTPPSTPSRGRRESQDTIASGFTGFSIPIPVKSLDADGYLSLPQVTNSCMVHTNQMGQNKSMYNRRGNLPISKSYPGPGHMGQGIVDLQTLGKEPLATISKNQVLPQKMISLQGPVRSCVQCKQLVREDNINGTKCRYHKGSFHSRSFMWTCCRGPKAHPGCVINVHKVKR